MKHGQSYEIRYTRKHNGKQVYSHHTISGIPVKRLTRIQLIIPASRPPPKPLTEGEEEKKEEECWDRPVTVYALADGCKNTTANDCLSIVDPLE